MPLIKYYQPGFYIVNSLLILATGMNAAKSALLLTVFGHLLAVFMTFFLCLKVTKKVFASALSSLFVLINTFISLRSYGWEPVTVVFLFLYPLGLFLFFNNTNKPFRLSLIIVLALSYYSHPLIWFSLCLFIGIYILFVLFTSNKNTYQLWQFFALVFASLLLGARQFIPQITYQQVTSGAHMGVSYLPYYQVPFNIISLKDFFFDAGNLKGPGPIILIASLFLIAFLIFEKKKMFYDKRITAVSIVLLVMILLYYFELYRVFPMNYLRGIQYHRMIPEFVITACLLVALFSTKLTTNGRKLFYYITLIGFVFASTIIIYNVQDQWKTIDSISEKPEFIHERIDGRISFPYVDQSLSVRNSFTNQYQLYGYYEQGITNSYADEGFSVSSGYHDIESIILYLKALNIQRLYVNHNEGRRDEIVMKKFSSYQLYEFNERYSYYEINLTNPALFQGLNYSHALKVLEKKPGCRELYKVVYCGSKKEEFVDKDPEEINYLKSYLNMVEKSNTYNVTYEIINPDNYVIQVSDADEDLAVLVKMTYDKSFVARINDTDIDVINIGPDFMLLYPNKQGNFTITLSYQLSLEEKIGAVISILSLLLIIIYYLWKPKYRYNFIKGDMK